jgi:hypothetical protein
MNTANGSEQGAADVRLRKISEIAVILNDSEGSRDRKADAGYNV